MKLIFNGLLFVFVSSIANAAYICVKEKATGRVYQPMAEMDAISDGNEKLDYYRAYTKALNVDKTIEPVPCPNKLGALDTSSIHKAKLVAQDKSMNNDCLVSLTSEPYCVSKINAKNFCSKADNQMLATAKQCINNFKDSAPNKLLLHSTCLGAGTQGRDPEEDKSNCVKESTKVFQKVDS